MLELLQGLADMCGVRDRHRQDQAFLNLVVLACQGAARQVRLMQPQGDEDPQEWLPVLTYCRTPGASVSAEGAACVLSYPIGLNGIEVARLEVQVDSSLTDESAQSLTSVLRAYLNLLDFLEFGEQDALTGLRNRKSFDQAIIHLVQGKTDDAGSSDTLGAIDRRQNPSGLAHWIAVLDIDHFKRVNDDFGHLIGDEVLVLMARLMRANFRARDKVFRFGGEEFVVLLNGASPEQAAAAFERLRSRVAEQSFPRVERITVSLGYSQFIDDDTPTGAVGRADKAVYYAKDNGRNQVRCYETLISAGLLDDAPETFQEVDFF